MFPSRSRHLVGYIDGCWSTTTKPTFVSITVKHPLLSAFRNRFWVIVEVHGFSEDRMREKIEYITLYTENRSDHFELFGMARDAWRVTIAPKFYISKGQWDDKYQRAQILAILAWFFFGMPKFPPLLKLLKI